MSNRQRNCWQLVLHCFCCWMIKEFLAGTNKNFGSWDPSQQKQMMHLKWLGKNSINFLRNWVKLTPPLLETNTAIYAILQSCSNLWAGWCGNCAKFWRCQKNRSFIWDPRLTFLKRRSNNNKSIFFHCSWMNFARRNPRRTEGRHSICSNSSYHHDFIWNFFFATATDEFWVLLACVLL